MRLVKGEMIVVPARVTGAGVEARGQRASDSTG